MSKKIKMPLINEKLVLEKYIEQSSKLYDLCIEILAHIELDCEITILGNGYNAGELSGVVKKIIKIMHFDIKNEDVEKVIEELKIAYSM